MDKKMFYKKDLFYKKTYHNIKWREICLPPKQSINATMQ